MAPRCLTCRAEVKPRLENRWFPFCSERCRLVDLGKWLGEEYRVGSKEPEAEEDDEGAEQRRSKDTH